MSKRNRKNPAPARSNNWMILGIGTVLVVALIAYAMTRSNTSGAVEATRPAPAPMAAAPDADHDHGAESTIRRMTATELRSALDRGEAVVIDVRDIDSYAAGHIAGSMHIPLEFIESQLPHLPRDKALVTYCT
jgi:phage shock protein E